MKAGKKLGKCKFMNSSKSPRKKVIGRKPPYNTIVENRFSVLNTLN